MENKDKNILWFKDITKDSLSLVGGKGANLGEMWHNKIPVPPGFAVTSKAYFDFLKIGSLKQKLQSELRGLNLDNSKELITASENIETAIKRAKMPSVLIGEITEAYKQLSGSHDILVAVRSSATAEDLPDASFAGQQKTFLNISGAEDLVKAVKDGWASLFEPRAIFYRADKKYDNFKVGISIIVQRMIQSEVSGIMFTVDPLTNNRDRINIEAAYGLGEAVVSGSLTPDQYLLEKKSLKIIEKRIVKQDWQLIRRGKVKISPAFQRNQKLSDHWIRELAKVGVLIETHYNFPQDIEWALSDNQLFIVQTRPVTTLKDRGDIDQDKIEKELSGKGLVLLKGIGASPGVASGRVRKIESIKEMSLVEKGEVLVTKMTNPDYVPVMRRVVAVITDEGGRTSHAAIVSRELGMPCVVGTETATKMLKDGEMVTVDGANGLIYEGALGINTGNSSVQPPDPASHEPVNHLRTATKLYVNLSEPSAAAAVAKRNVDGIGLLRAEFILAEIGEHPKSFLKTNRRQEFIDILTKNLTIFAKSFQPRPVVYRASDFKTNEYRHLRGGEEFEAEEGNPFLGFRGALRYVTDAEVFEMELAAIKNVRNKEGFKNLHLMIPFVRSPNELTEVKKIASAAGLRRGPNFQIWMMVEIPSNVISLEEYIAVGIDGISIGSNDLTMLTLGADRDNRKISGDYNEMNPAVLFLLEKAITTARKNKIKVSICGQAPSDYPDLVKKLVHWGISSISVNPDAIEKTRTIISAAEHEIVKGNKI